MGKPLLVLALIASISAPLAAQQPELIEQMKQSAKKQGFTITDEEARQLALKQLELQMRFQALGQQLGQMQGADRSRSMPQATFAPPMQPMSTAAAETEQSLKAELAVPPPTVHVMATAADRDGLLINGRPYLDPAGHIAGHAIDPASGQLGYLVRQPDGRGLVRLTNGFTMKPPVTIATVYEGSDGISVATVTGQELTGASLYPTADGFVVGRDGAVFRYIAGQGIQPYQLPQGWSLAEVQRGAIGGTGFVLLERTYSREVRRRGSNAAGFIDAMKSLGAAVGVNRKEDFAFYNLTTGEVTPLNIDSADKDVQQHYDCRRSGLINKCTGLNSYEAIYKPDGRPNGLHYFWRVDWFSTPIGPYAVVMEAGSTEINAIELSTGARRSLRKRTLGLGTMNAVHEADGRIRIEIDRGLAHESIDDVVAAIRTSQQTSLIDAAPAGTPTAGARP